MTGIRPRLGNQINATPALPFTYGRFNLSSWRVPFFQVSLTLGEVSQSLRLVSEFPGAEQWDWRIEELYQRDVDWQRVRKQIVPYLRNGEQPQFFNSLTVALLPVRDHGIVDATDDGGWTAPSFEHADQFAKLICHGPFAAGYYQEWSSFDDPGASFGQLRWNRQQVFAVAIDGQHRLAALKEHARGLQFQQALDQTRVPVILVVLAPQLGYEAPQPHKPQVQVLRRLFIDLNRHAKVVKRSRQILLDDADPNALCVRALVEGELSVGDASLYTSPPRIPLTLIDWHSDQALFDDGPYLSTILGLDWAVSTVLGARPLKDYAEHNAVKSYLTQLTRSLGLDFVSAESPIARRLEECERAERPFTFLGSPDAAADEPSELKDIVRAFSHRWQPALVHLLAEFAPYKRVLQLRRANGTLTPTFINWYYLHARTDGGADGQEYRELLQRLRDQEHPMAEGELLDQLQTTVSAKGHHLAFKVVFQRALFDALMWLAKVNDEILPEDESDVDDVTDDLLEEPAESPAPVLDLGEHNTRRAKQLVEALNFCEEALPELFSHDFVVELDDSESFRFWLGTLLTADNNIDFTQSASIRARDVLVWIGILWILRQRDDESLSEDMESFLEALEDGSDAQKKLYQALRRFANVDRGAARRILEAADEEVTAEAAWEVTKQRFAVLWQLIVADPHV